MNEQTEDAENDSLLLVVEKYVIFSSMPCIKCSQGKLLIVDMIGMLTYALHLQLVR